MSVMVIDYGAINDITTVATRLADAFESKKENFVCTVNELKLIPTSRNNLRYANDCINKKNIQYQSKIDKLKLFGIKMSQFSDKAKQSDQRVASRITSITEKFEKDNGISISATAVWLDKVKNVGISILSTAILGGNGLSQKDVRGIKDGIKDWYNNGGKYKIKAVETIALAVLAAAVTIFTLGTGAMFFFGILSLALLAIDTVASVHYDIKASQKGSNRLEAERLSGKGGFEMVAAAGNKVDRKFKTNCFETGLSGAYVALSAADFVYGIRSLGKSFRTELKNVNLATKYARNNGRIAGIKHFAQKSYTSVNSKFTRENTTRILKPIQSILKNNTQHYFQTRKVINTVLKPVRYYKQLKNYTLYPKYKAGKKIANRLLEPIIGPEQLEFSY